MTDEKTRPTVTELNLDPKAIKITEGNRLVDPDDAFQELRASIKKDGLLNPVLVLDHTNEEGESTYTLIAGERRLRACLDLKLESIPVRAFVASDDEVLAIRAIENLHRKNLGPIEEARQFKDISEKWGDVKMVAHAVGKPLAYVGRSLMLLELPTKVQDFIAQGELTAEHGHQLMRCAEKQREKLAEFVTKRNWAKKLPTVDELKAEIANRAERDLSGAAFPKDREFAGKIPCSSCEYNSGNQSMLFPGGEKGVCSGPACFALKEKTFYEEYASKAGTKLERFKAFGVVKDNGYQGAGGTVKGHPVLSDEVLSDKSVKDAMEAHPEAYGWALMRPGPYSESKKPRVVFVALDPGFLPKKFQPRNADDTGRDYEAEQRKAQFFLGHRRVALLEALDKEFDGKSPSMKHLAHIALITAGDNGNAAIVLSIIKPWKGEKETVEIENMIRKLDRADLMRFIWLASFPLHQTDHYAQVVGVNAKKIMAAADKVSEVEWKKMLDNSEPKK
jgi:ParB/RepB/Spo0J family partition protein